MCRKGGGGGRKLTRSSAVRTTGSWAGLEEEEE